MISAYQTDWVALGLPSELGVTAFTSVPPRGVSKSFTPQPIKKNRSKVQQAVMALETPEERKARQEAEILTKNKYSDIARSTDADKTGRIVGRRNGARSQ